MRGRFHDVTGKRFGKLVAVRPNGVRTYPSGKQLTLWECDCDCGNKTTVTLSALVTGNTKSCGCLHCGHNATIAEATRTHGKSNTRLYVLWKQIRKRCNNPHDRVYKYYGGRGVTVCQEWQNSFEAFYKWAIENGYDEDAPRGECTIDRINPYLGYCPDNCRWVSMTVQRHNRRSNWDEQNSTSL